MPVIALISNKGGAGKTTLCVNMALGRAQDRATVILDADPQASATHWYHIADDSATVVVETASHDIASDVAALAKRHERIYIDCPPSANSAQTKQALRVADVVLVPVQPSPLDIWASIHAEEEIEAARRSNPALQAWLVINQFEPRTRLSQQMHRAMAELDIPTTATHIQRRVIFRSSFLRGLSVHDAGAKGKQAAQEIMRLLQEIGDTQ